MAPTSKDRFKHGEPVWANMEGYPWWPARIVNRGEVVLDAGEGEPRVKEGEVLVEFFNDNKRFAAMHENSLRPFTNKGLTRKGNNYNGQFQDLLHDAIQEAKDYCREKGYKVGTSDGSGSRPFKPKSTTHDREPFLEDDDEQEPEQKKGKRVKKKPSRNDREKDHKYSDDGKGKRGRKRPSANSEEDLDDLDREREKKKKKVVIKREPSPSEPSDDDQRDVPVKTEKQQKRKNKNKRKHRDPQADDHMHKFRDDEDSRHRRRDEEGDGVTIEGRVADQADPHKQKRRKESKPQKDEAILPMEAKHDESGRGIEESDDFLVKKVSHLQVKREKGDKKPKRGRSDKIADMKPTDSGLHRRAKREHAVPSYPEEVRKGSSGEKGDASADGNLLTSPDSVDGFPSEEGAAYLSLSKEQLISVIVARDRELRSHSVQLWRYRMQNAKDNGPKTLDELYSTCMPAFKAVADFLTVSESEAHRKVKSAKWKELESLAVENIRELQLKHFDISLLKKDPKLTSRAIKLAHKSSRFSWEVAMGFRELLLQWTEIGAIEQAPEDERASRTHAESADPDSSPKELEDSKGRVQSSLTKDSDVHTVEKDISRLDARATDVAKSPESKSAEAKSVDDKSPEQKSSPTKTSSETKAPDVKVLSPNRSGNAHTEDDKSSPAGTPRRDALRHSRSPEEKTSPKGEGNSDSKQDKNVRRVKEFSTQKCVTLLQNMMEKIASLESDRATFDNKKPKELAEAVERLITPRREEDAFTYFKMSKKFCRALNALSSPNPSQDGDTAGSKEAKLRNALFECVKDKTTLPSFVKRLSNW